MAKLYLLKMILLLISIIAVVSLVAMFHYTISSSPPQITLQMKSEGMLTNGLFDTRTLSSNNAARSDVSHMRIRDASTTHDQFKEGSVESRLEQNPPPGDWNKSLLCPENGSSLVGPVYVDKSVPEMKDVENQMSSKFNGWVSNGGSWKPTECQARVKMALIIPFRNRSEQLSIFVRHMHPFLKKQDLDYRIFVVEQAGDAPFNRAILFNIGYKESLKFDEYECFIFHDVDLIPEDDRNQYSCPSSPRHLSVAVDKFHYRLPYNTIFGGAAAFSREHFDLVNGYSNIFWGWGGEDDNLQRRISVKGLKLTRPSIEKGRYKMIKIFHTIGKRPDLNIRRNRMKEALKQMNHDGLNSLKYNAEVTEHRLFTLIGADVFYEAS